MGRFFLLGLNCWGETSMNQSTSVESLGGPWHPGSGKVAERTDLVIAALLQQEFDSFSTSTLDTAIEKIADVHSDQTVQKYRRLVIQNGPFSREGPGRFQMDR